MKFSRADIPDSQPVFMKRFYNYMRIEKINIYFLLLAPAGALVIFLGTSRFGVGISPDSVNYISCARELIKGNGFLSFDGTPITLWPPLYPTLLGILGLSGIDPVIGARILNVFVFGLIVFCTGQLFRSCLRSDFLIISGTIFASFSAQVIYLSFMAWSELLFSLFCVLFIKYLINFSIEMRKKDFYLLSVIVALSCLQRYIGIAMVATALAAILLLVKIPVSERLKYSIRLFIISLTPLFFWLLRNYILTSTMSGPRTASSYSFNHNIAKTFDVITAWFIPSSAPFHIRLIFAGILSITLVSIAISTYYKKNGSKINMILIKAGYILIYVLFVIILSSVSSLDPIPYRYLAPVYIIFICLVFILLEIASEWLNEKIRIKNFGKYVVILLCLAWYLYAITNNYTDIMFTATNGAGYSSNNWRLSPILKYIKNNPLNGKIYSNAPDAVYILSGIKAEWIPRREEGFDNFKKKTMMYGNNYVVWINNVSERSYLHDIKDISNNLGLINHSHFPDGDIYLLYGKNNS